MRTIDMHGHLLSPAWLDEILAKPPRTYGVSARVTEEGYLIQRPGQADYHIPTRLTDVAARIAAMDSMGVDAQLVAPTSSSLMYDLGRNHAQAMARTQNETIADLASNSGGRLIPAATVPMMWPDLAVAELDHAVVKLGIRVLFMSTFVAGYDLDDARFALIFRRAAELGVPVQIHPSPEGIAGRLRKHFLENSLGNPIESAIAAGSLITGGVLDTNPDLRILLVHGGGLSHTSQAGWTTRTAMRGRPRRGNTAPGGTSGDSTTTRWCTTNARCASSQRPSGRTA
jgi:aminocarboxymuconate-semialdehyde decarboxylase